MPLELFIALRYLKAERKGLFAVVTTLIGVAGVTVGVAALLTTLSVMNGFQTDIQRKIVGAQAHVTVLGLRSAADLAETEAKIKADPDTAALAPFALGQAILTVRDRSIGVVLKGVEPAREFAVNDLAAKLVSGSWDGIGEGKTPGIVLGVELADHLGVEKGDEVVLVSPKSVATPLGLLPKMQRFRVAGTLKTGYYEYDSATAWTGLPAAAKFLGVDAGASGVGVRLKDLGRADAAAQRLRVSLGLTKLVRTYAQMNTTLFAALKLEKTVMFIILTLITLVASLGIASTLILRSVEKTRDIGLLKAMGAGPAMIRRIFLVEGFLIGSSGVLMGLGLGFILCWAIASFQIVELPADIYYLSRVPVDVRPSDVAAVAGMGLLLSLLATLYPSSRAAKADPVEAIHYG
ncbi:MAG: ABC transporter permease [Elusimicrobiota bacterium]|nr:MAG: ABC transporter permease [Elusimicrobiota bacterium]